MRMHCKRFGYIAFAGLLTLPGVAAGQQLSYPQTLKSDVADEYFGTTVADPYRWLEATDSPATTAWVEAENAVSFGYLNKLPDRAAFRKRLTDLWNYERFGVPFKEGGHYFYTRNSGLQNQSVVYVQSALDAPARVLIDPNTLSTDGTVALSSPAASEDGRYFAYATAASGSDWNDVHVREIATGTDLGDHIEWVKFSSIVWTKDSKGFFYSRYATPTSGNKMLAANKDHLLYYHVVGTDQSRDRQMYADPAHPDRLIDSDITDDGRYMLLYISEGSSSNNRIYVGDLENGKAPNLAAKVSPLFDAADARYGVIGNDGPLFYVQTNKDAPRQRVVAVDIRHPESSAWKEIVPTSADALQSASIIGNRIVVQYLHDAASTVRFFSLNGSPLGELKVPVLGAIGGVSGKRESTEMFYSFTSFLYPTTIFRYDVATGSNKVFRAPRVDFDPTKYETKEVFYTSKDGTRVPMFVTARKGIKLDGNNPTLLYSYGGFNISMTPAFSVGNAVWLERGGVYAQPSIRGGSEYGEDWHKAGTKERKQNVFDDFIGAAEYLIKEGYTKPAKLVIKGGSNGGLLVGAVMNQRPDLFGVALPAVGVMDMLRFHKFTIGWAWVSDYGSSDDAQGFGYLSRYSPLQNIKPGTCYPATLVTTADHDDRVVPGHSFKYAATLQAAQSCDKPVLIRIETKAGHGAGKPISKVIEEAADQLAFAWKNLGMTAVP
jgi:prolyl oligopeptidase